MLGLSPGPYLYTYCVYGDVVSIRFGVKGCPRSQRDTLHPLMHGRFYRPITKVLWEVVKIRLNIFFMGASAKKVGKSQEFIVLVTFSFFCKRTKNQSRQPKTSEHLLKIKIKKNSVAHWGKKISHLKIRWSKKQGKTVHRLQIYIYIHVLLLCVMCADLHLQNPHF